MSRSIRTAASLALGLTLLAVGSGSSFAATRLSAATAGSPTTTTTPLPGPSSALATLLPPAIQSAGVLRVVTGVSASAADSDLARATAQAFGLRVRFVRASDVTAAVVTGRGDVGWAALPDERAQRARVTFVDYLKGAGAKRLGIAVKHNEGQLVGALQAALGHLRQDGTYRRILARHGLASRAVAAFTVNGAA